MMRALVWGLAGFAAGAYMMARAGGPARRALLREARRVGRRMERTAARAMRSRGMKWVNDAVQALTGG
ncbi:MAG TPA: hypothetical protein VKZ69_03175 [Limnochordales bacterium]|nr:hypothetical protein [Limnochordales bacterium]